MPSVWEVVSAYLHSGTAAVEAVPDPMRGSSDERVAQVRGLLDRIDNEAPKVSPGSAREALRQLFTDNEVKESPAAQGARSAPASTSDLTTRPSPPSGPQACPAPERRPAPAAAETPSTFDHLPPPPSRPLRGAPARADVAVPPSLADPAPAELSRVERSVHPADHSDPLADEVVIDLRDGVDMPVEEGVLRRFERVSPAAPANLRREAPKHRAARRDSADDAVVRWYAMRHGSVPQRS